MADMPPPEKKRRAANFSEEELITLITEVAQKREVILGTLSTEVTAKAKDSAWRQVTDAVNSMSRVIRDVGEIKKKFRNFRSDVKKKAAKEMRERKMTGGGKREDSVWKPSEEAMLSLLEREAIEGFPGIQESEEPDLSDKPQPSTSGAIHGRRVSEETRLDHPSQPHTSWGLHGHNVLEESGLDDPLPVLQSTCSTDQSQSLLAELVDESGVASTVEVIHLLEDSSNISVPETLTEEHMYSRRGSPPPKSSRGSSPRPKSRGQSRPSSPRARSRGPSSRGSPEPNLLEQMLTVQMEIRDTLRDVLQQIASSLAVIADVAAQRR